MTTPNDDREPFGDSGELETPSVFKSRFEIYRVSPNADACEWVNEQLDAQAQDAFYSNATLSSLDAISVNAVRKLEAFTNQKLSELAEAKRERSKSAADWLQQVANADKRISRIKAENDKLRAELDGARAKEIEAYNKGVLAAAKDLEENHWNDARMMTNQRDQAFRSANAIRRLVKPLPLPPALESEMKGGEG